MSDAVSSAISGDPTLAAARRGPTARGPWKLLATVLVVAAGVAALIFFSLDAAVAQYMEIGEATRDLAAVQGKRLQVHGYVVDGSVAQKPGTLQYRFDIHDSPTHPTTRVTAYYEGIVPDTFKGRAEVVATGVFDAEGALRVEAGGIMAKCPSRYEAKDDDLARLGAAEGAARAPAPTPAAGASPPAP